MLHFIYKTKLLDTFNVYLRESFSESIYLLMLGMVPHTGQKFDPKKTMLSLYGTTSPLSNQDYVLMCGLQMC